MRIPTFFLFSIALIVACNNQKSTTEDETAFTESVTPEEHDPAGETVTFVNAVVYAGSTDYIFESESGEEITVRVSNIPEEGEFVPVIPEGLLETGGEEGPPGANPAMVGKKFTLIRNEPGEVIEVIAN